MQRPDAQLDGQQRDGRVVGLQADALLQDLDGTGRFPRRHQRQGKLVPQMELLEGELHGSLQTLGGSSERARSGVGELYFDEQSKMFCE